MRPPPCSWRAPGLRPGVPKAERGGVARLLPSGRSHVSPSTRTCQRTSRSPNTDHPGGYDAGPAHRPADRVESTGGFPQSGARGDDVIDDQRAHVRRRPGSTHRTIQVVGALTGTQSRRVQHDPIEPQRSWRHQALAANAHVRPPGQAQHVVAAAATGREPARRHRDQHNLTRLYARNSLTGGPGGGTEQAGEHAGQVATAMLFVGEQGQPQAGSVVTGRMNRHVDRHRGRRHRPRRAQGGAAGAESRASARAAQAGSRQQQVAQAPANSPRTAPRPITAPCAVRGQWRKGASKVVDIGGAHRVTLQRRQPQPRCGYWT